MLELLIFPNNDVFNKFKGVSLVNKLKSILLISSYENGFCIFAKFSNV